MSRPLVARRGVSIFPGSKDVSEYRHHGLEARATEFNQPGALPVVAPSACRVAGAEGARTRRGGLLKNRSAGAGREGKPFYIYRRRCAPGGVGAQRRERENGFGAGQVVRKNPGKFSAHIRCAQRAGAGRVVSCEESGGYGVQGRKEGLSSRDVSCGLLVF